MKVIMIREKGKPEREYPDDYALRLIEQGKAIRVKEEPAAAGKAVKK